ncbi:MAG: hypothetical protein EOM20_11620 [Spartobacteria bacterium]|nr:hypothetical protein [Spartobacteria bacterium]
MRMMEALRILRGRSLPFFETGDAAVLLKTSRAHASKILSRLEESELVLSLKRGLWCFPDRVQMLQLPAALTAPLPCYISLQSALYRHGMISQIPHVVYAVSTARTHRWNTPMGVVSVHHVCPEFFMGYEMLNGHVPMAVPEKALLDILYLSPTRTRLFQALPELEYLPSFDVAKARAMIESIPSARHRAIVRHRLDALPVPSSTIR